MRKDAGFSMTECVLTCLLRRPGTAKTVIAEGGVNCIRKLMHFA